MAVRAGAAQQAVDEIFVQNDAVSVCMLVNRRARTVRVIDFRAGPSDAKRRFVLSIAKREGAAKAFTVVERDEVSTWLKLGFSKEGNIPSFYKRSDAFLLGCFVPRDLDPDEFEVPCESETRIVIPSRDPQAERGLTAHDLMEKTVTLAKKLSKELPSTLPQAKVGAVTFAEARKSLATAARHGRSLGAFEPFGRDAECRYFSVAARGGFELCASIETQACFGNAVLEVSQSPKNHGEMVGTAAALNALCSRLLTDETVSCFSLAPSDDVLLGAAFVHNGFRRTGLLLNHMLVGGRRLDAIVWSRKLGVVSAE
jgi:hypothetical protein